MKVPKEFLDTIKYVSDMLVYRVEATPVSDETMSVPVEGMDGVMSVWTRQITTYTLGLMLGGALSLLEET